MREMAAWAEQQCNEQYADSVKGNYTGLSADMRWYYGFLGELVFVRYCQVQWLRHRYEPAFKGRDITDIEIWLKRYGKLGIDVKTASKPSHRYLMIPEAQLRSHPSEMYVGVRINGPDEGEILGFCLKKDLQPITNMGLKIPTRGIAFDRLLPIERLTTQAVKVMG